jgi:hypothetical protein
MISQDVIRKLWDTAGFGNVAVWADGTMTVVPVDYPGETAGKKPLVIFKPIKLVNRYEFLDLALNDKELQKNIEDTLRTAGVQGARDLKPCEGG